MPVNQNKEIVGNIFKCFSNSTPATNEVVTIDDDCEEKYNEKSTASKQDDTLATRNGSLEKLEKRFQHRSKSWITGEASSTDVIVISSDDDQNESDEDCDGTNFKTANVLELTETEKHQGRKASVTANEPTEELCCNDKLKTKKDKDAINWFFSSRKVKKALDFNERDAKKKSNGVIRHTSQKKLCDHSSSLSNSPLGRSFFAKMKTEQSEWMMKLGTFPPLLPRLNGPRDCSTLKPRDFSTSQSNCIDDLAGDSMFYSAYIDSALSFASRSIAPPHKVVMYVYSVIAQCNDDQISVKAINCLHRLLSMRILTHQNFPLTWDMLGKLACRVLQELTSGSCAHNGSLDKSQRLQSDIKETRSLRLFVFTIHLLEVDFKRFVNSRRNSILWKILSPNLYGNSRVRVAGDWLVKTLQAIEDAQTPDNNNQQNARAPRDHSSISENARKMEQSFLREKVTKVSECSGKKWFSNVPACEECTNEDSHNVRRGFGSEARRSVSEQSRVEELSSGCSSTVNRFIDEPPSTNMTEKLGKVILNALQRLFSLVFIVSKDPKREAQVIAEAFLNTFLELRTLRCRKMLLSSIESLLVQQVTAELVLSTVFEGTSESLEDQELITPSLETFIYGYCYMRLPRVDEGQSVEHNIELFVYLLFLFARSYLALRNTASQDSINSLSMANEYCEMKCETKSEGISLKDREIMRTVIKEIDLLRRRLLLYRGTEKLSGNSEMYLNMLARSFHCINHTSSLFHIS